VFAGVRQGNPPRPAERIRGVLDPALTLRHFLAFERENEAHWPPPLPPPVGGDAPCRENE